MVEDEISSSKEQQRTIEKEVSIEGIGLFTGCKTSMRLLPAEENQGIVFKRIDLPSAPSFNADVDHVIETPRCTILGNGAITLQTVEHILSAIKAFDLDNLMIEVDGPEIPSADGSALPFVQLLEEAGVQIQHAHKKIHRLEHPVYWSKGDVHLVALPSDEFRISYTLNYPNSSLLKSQYYTFPVSLSAYKEEIAPARTFSLYEEIVPLIEQGKIKGGTLENAVIVKGDKIINPEGARFEDEMVRHKILDLIGDLSLVRCRFLMHVIAIRSGHFSNTSFAKEIVRCFNLEKKS